MANNNDMVPSINMLDVLRGIGHRKTLVISIFAAALVAGLVFVKTAKPVYTTEAQIIVENLSSPFDRTQAQTETGGAQIDDRTIQSQITILKSSDLGNRVISELALKNDPGFNRPTEAHIGVFKSIMLQLGFGTDPRKLTAEDRALADYMDGLNVFQVPASNVITIKYTAGEAKVAADVANTLAKLYVAITAETMAQPTRRAREWLAKQIEALRNKVAASESEIEKFRTQAGLMKGSGSTLGSQELTELNSQITLAETTKSEAQARAAAIKSVIANKGSLDDSVDVLNSPSIQRLREQQSTAARKVSELATIYLPNHPKMIAAQSDLNSVDRQIRSEALKIADGFIEQAKLATARQNALIAKLEQSKTKEASANLDDVKLRALERDAAADKALLESLLLRYADASARQDITMQPGIARVIQQAAVPPAPSFPKSGPTVLLIGFGGLALGLGLAFILEIMAATNRLSQQLANTERGAAPAVLASQTAVLPNIVSAQTHVPAQTINIPAHFPIPPALGNLKLPTDQTQVIELANQQAQAESSAHPDFIKKMSAWLTAQPALVPIKTLSIVTVRGREQDTAYFSAALSRHIASQGQKTLVADMAINGSTLEKIFSTPTQSGVTDLLAGTVDFTKVIQRDPKSAVQILGVGTQRQSVTAGLLANKIMPIVQTLRKIFDMVIVNCGEGTALNPALIACSDALIILVPKTHSGDGLLLLQSLVNSGAKNVQYFIVDDVTP